MITARIAQLIGLQEVKLDKPAEKQDAPVESKPELSLAEIAQRGFVRQQIDEIEARKNIEKAAKVLLAQDDVAKFMADVKDISQPANQCAVDEKLREAYKSKIVTLGKLAAEPAKQAYMTFMREILLNMSEESIKHTVETVEAEVEAAGEQKQGIEESKEGADAVRLAVEQQEAREFVEQAVEHGNKLREIILGNDRYKGEINVKLKELLDGVNAELTEFKTNWNRFTLDRCKKKAEILLYGVLTSLLNMDKEPLKFYTDGTDEYKWQRKVVNFTYWWERAKNLYYQENKVIPESTTHGLVLRTFDLIDEYHHQKNAVAQVKLAP